MTKLNRWLEGCESNECDEMKCIRQCGRKATPGRRYCQQCEERTFQRPLDQGRYRPPKRFGSRDVIKDKRKV